MIVVNATTLAKLDCDSVKDLPDLSDDDRAAFMDWKARDLSRVGDWLIMPPGSELCDIHSASHLAIVGDAVVLRPQDEIDAIELPALKEAAMARREEWWHAQTVTVHLGTPPQEFVFPMTTTKTLEYTSLALQAQFAIAKGQPDKTMELEDADHHRLTLTAQNMLRLADMLVEDGEAKRKQYLDLGQAIRAAVTPADIPDFTIP